MKISLLITILILLATVAADFWQRQKSDSLRQEQEKWRAEAVSMGIDPQWLEKGTVHPGGTLPRKLTQQLDAAAARAGRETKTREFARELIAFAKDQKERQAKGISQQDPEHQKKMMAMMEGLLALKEDDFRVLVDEFQLDQSIGAEAKGELIGMSIMLFGQEKPAAALSLMLENRSLLTSSRGLTQMAGMCLGKLAEQDPGAALEWMEKNKDSGMVDHNARRHAIAGLAKTDPELALRRVLATGAETKAEEENTQRELASSVGMGADKNSLLAALRNLSAEGPSGGTDPEKLKKVEEAVLSGLGGRLVHEGLDASREWLTSETLSESEKETVLNSLAGSLHGTDPAPWLGLLGETLPPEKMKEKLGMVIPQWTRRDFNAVGNWLNQQPAGGNREQATLLFAETLAPHEPDAARQWVEALPESGKKNEILGKIQEELSKTAPIDEPAE